MKGLIFVVLVLTLAGCRTKRMVTEGCVVDTTKLRMDSDFYRMGLTEGLRMATDGRDWQVVDFVDGGGCVTVDSAGGLRMTGVKGYRRLKARRVEMTGGRVAAVDSGRLSAVRENGVGVKVRERTSLTGWLGLMRRAVVLVAAGLVAGMAVMWWRRG